MTSYSAFQRRLQAGQIVVTGELAPPKGAARATLERLALGMRNAVDAINLTDNQRGVGRMSALGAGVVMRQLGIEPIVQMTCQHRNRIAVQEETAYSDDLLPRHSPFEFRFAPDAGWETFK